MRSKFQLLAGCVAVTAALGLATASLAQEPPPGGPPPMAGHAHWAERMQAHRQAKAQALHDILNIRPEQDAAFQSFIGSMKPPGEHGRMGDRRDHDDMATLTTPERLDKMAARMAKRQAAFQQRADATRRFYAVLTPSQQRAFDALHGLMGGDHEHGGGHEWGGEGHRGPPPPPQG